jgi:hypothetical protein
MTLVGWLLLALVAVCLLGLLHASLIVGGKADDDAEQYWANRQ